MSLLKSIANALTFRNSRGAGICYTVNYYNPRGVIRRPYRKGTDTITSVGTISLLHKGYVDENRRVGPNSLLLKSIV